MVPDTESINGLTLLPGVTRSSSGAANSGGSGRRVESGRFEVWICAACGYTEWYAHEVNEALAWLTQHPHSGVRYYDADAVARPASAD
ncbi:hypothetical protein ACFO1B_46125 [Dactylosporangium siamense]|uniref:Uncharacterized protein n=1 Tax=Dactylosporangium siamense TaxID=685454 RepID=A0A919UIA3_9ACTN|nr:hypothetical protein [Dactylosporangium siamense]GIG51493.1 hypothetical protein Dsi01nite_095340 [Dactylosporangium siamense]